MLVAPSLHKQVIQIAKREESGVFCACSLVHEPSVLASVFKVDEKMTRKEIEETLPMNLVPAAVIFLSPDSSPQASQVAEKLQVKIVYEFQLKSRCFFVAGERREDILAKSDPFLSSLLVGTTFRGTKSAMSI